MMREVSFSRSGVWRMSERGEGDSAVCLQLFFFFYFLYWGFGGWLETLGEERGGDE